MSLELIRGLYEYHRWANHRLFEVTLARGEEAAERDMGKQWSFPSIRRMFAHIYGADAIWLGRWQGQSMTAIPGADIPSMAALRQRWDVLIGEQRTFLDALAPGDLSRVIEYKNTQGQAFRAPLGSLLPHVPNHATHHRSEIATMLTLISGSPPDTGMNSWILATTGQG